ncbi:MAG: zinc ribbon domain-containing protein [Anaerolineae bacterium]|nr:zinc ribbon domain-containing protein [Anaerolineae bacterium]
MPLYEYYCPHCELTFELRRPFSQADDPAPCPQCQAEDTKRMLSTFVCMSQGGTSASSGGGCSGCSASSCAGCKR